MKFFTFNKKNNKPVLSKCRNCGTETKGPYCHLCGQSLFAGKEGFTESFFNNALSLYSVDFKIFRTIKLLLFYPGKLTKEYSKGHIIRYEHPFKLFWFVALLFFLFFIVCLFPEVRAAIPKSYGICVAFSHFPICILRWFIVNFSHRNFH